MQRKAGCRAGGKARLDATHDMQRPNQRQRKARCNARHPGGVRCCELDATQDRVRGAQVDSSDGASLSHVPRTPPTYRSPPSPSPSPFALRFPPSFPSTRPQELVSTTTDLSLSAEERLRLEQHISSYEGEDFVSSGVLSQIVSSPQGSAVHLRRLWYEDRGAMYEQKRLMTYFWERIPRTAMTAVISIPGAPVPNTSVIVRDELVDSVKCGTEPASAEPAQVLTAPLCWGGDGDLVYHRTETVTSGARRQATEEEEVGGGGGGGGAEGGAGTGDAGAGLRYAKRAL